MAIGKNKAAAALGKLGGKSRSQAKIDAVRINVAKARAARAAAKAGAAPQSKVQDSVDYGTDHDANESS